MERKEHWEEVYSTRGPDAVSWYAPHLSESLKYIRATGLDSSAAVIDVGAGEATLVDDLLDAGYRDVTVLDISGKALEVAAQRLGERSKAVKWLAADALEHEFEPNSVDIWHDRAVFHFLAASEQRQAYVAQVLRALKPGGFAVVGTFGPNGPDNCSGLPVMRYAPESLHSTFGERFKLMQHSIDLHTTPWGT